MLKIRLKQSVIERRARGPLAIKRQERLLHLAQRRLQKQNNTLASMYSVSMQISSLFDCSINLINFDEIRFCVTNCLRCDRHVISIDTVFTF